MFVCAACESDRSRGLTKGEDKTDSYLSFASLLGVAHVLKCVVHHGHSNHFGGVFLSKRKRPVKLVINR